MGGAASSAWTIVIGLFWVAGAVYMIVAPDVVGQARGWMGHGAIDTDTPGCMVRFAGCCMLAVIPGEIVGGALGWVAGVAIGLAVAVAFYVLANRLLGRW